MPLKPTEPRSIATQLVVLFTLSAALLLSCGLGVFYSIVVRHAVEEDNAALADKLAAIHADLRQPEGTDTIDRELKNRRSGEPAVYWVRLLNSAGVIVAETPGMSSLIPADVFPSPQTATFTARAIRNYSSAEKKFSLIATSESLDGADYIIQVAQDRSADERFRKQFGVVAISVVFIGSLFAAVLAITVTKRGLQPLARMRRLLERVQPPHLNERIDSARWPRELRPLAVSFDDMLERLENSFTRLSQFSADLAHELRTPIGNMLGEAQVALSRERRPEEYRAVIESAAAECERLSEIIDNLLFLARAESAEQKIDRKLFNGREALEKIAAFYQASAEDRHIEISCDGQANVFADPMLFNRAIGNLIDNALRATPNGGKIRLSVATKNGATEISVADTGSGISPEHLPRVFDRFYRADPSRSSARTGLGLSLVKSIVDLHGGSTRITSDLGHGTTVVLHFPTEGSA
jgi:two-component system heavy metal sensor histidine kinase CusS